MRIIAGKYKGKILKEFDLSSTRPTTDMVREALFDKIGLAVNGKIFLDLFAGTGATGIEALSRYAQFCYFVDIEKKATILIEKNLKLVGAENYEVLNNSYLDALMFFKNKKIKFDFVFLDPPYKKNFAEIAIEDLLTMNLLKDEGVIIWEHDQTKNDYIFRKYPEAITKKYGRKFLTYIENK